MFDKLPNEIIYSILLHFSGNELYVLSRLNKRFESLVKSCNVKLFFNGNSRLETMYFFSENCKSMKINTQDYDFKNIMNIFHNLEYIDTVSYLKSSELKSIVSNKSLTNISIYMFNYRYYYNVGTDYPINYTIKHGIFNLCYEYEFYIITKFFAGLESCKLIFSCKYTYYKFEEYKIESQLIKTKHLYLQNINILYIENILKYFPNVKNLVYHTAEDFKRIEDFYVVVNYLAIIKKSKQINIILTFSSLKCMILVFEKQKINIKYKISSSRYYYKVKYNIN